MKPLIAMLKSYRKNKVALILSMMLFVNEKYTFKEMKELSNKAGNVFKQYGMSKKVIVFLFLCQGHLNYILPC